MFYKERIDVENWQPSVAIMVNYRELAMAIEC